MSFQISFSIGSEGTSYIKSYFQCVSTSPSERGDVYRSAIRCKRAPGKFSPGMLCESCPTPPGVSQIWRVHLSLLVLSQSAVFETCRRLCHSLILTVLMFGCSKFKFPTIISQIYFLVVSAHQNFVKKKDKKNIVFASGMCINSSINSSFRHHFQCPRPLLLLCEGQL